nr:MAG TPA: hypothetical protein [Caudoviricetes sp.]
MPYIRNCFSLNKKSVRLQNCRTLSFILNLATIPTRL